MIIEWLKNKLNNDDMDEYERLRIDLELEKREEWIIEERRLARKIGLEV